MGKNLVINGVTYIGIEGMEIPTSDGGMANFIDEENAGAKLPELTNPASASDIVRNKEAIDGEGNVIKGNILDGGVGSTHTFVSSKAEPQMMNAGGFDIMPTVNFCSAIGQNDMVLRKTSPVKMTVNGQTFGTAQPSDVAAGKTFTSLYGLTLTGTAAGGGAVETAGVIISGEFADDGNVYYFSQNHPSGKKVAAGEILEETLPIGAVFLLLLNSNCNSISFVETMPNDNRMLYLNFDEVTPTKPSDIGAYNRIRAFTVPAVGVEIEFNSL